ncbi:hypothetical protein BDZ90DRAFT_235065 [Jaminaea rosea]|uniref:Uncharacterized protein n=1 Tax=Jaminaea rosea TaxID=1569628 RepID=A0A316UHE3_9BASI|nr:hypothetical protein BDZ90DRAFT_235065 [Jaminaea rosea]PWN24324.1 hypothetical protein BDZ90DRAFT_235065 [Jaminaea rosea]
MIPLRPLLLAALLLQILVTRVAAFDWQLISSDCSRFLFQITLIEQEATQGSYISIQPVVGGVSDNEFRLDIGHYYPPSNLQHQFYYYLSNSATGAADVIVTITIIGPSGTPIIYPQGTADDQETERFTLACSASSQPSRVSSSATSTFTYSTPSSSATAVPAATSSSSAPTATSSISSDCQLNCESRCPGDTHSGCQSGDSDYYSCVQRHQAQKQICMAPCLSGCLQAVASSAAASTSSFRASSPHSVIVVPTRTSVSAATWGPTAPPFAIWMTLSIVLGLVSYA